MADTKVSLLTAASTVTGTEELPVVQNGTSKRATIGQIASSKPWLTVDGIYIREGVAGPVYRTVGYNCYVMKVAGGTAGQTMDQVQREAFFAQLAPNSLTRVWASAPKPATYTWAAVQAELDAIVLSAREAGQRLIFTLTIQADAANDAFGGVKDQAWYVANTWRTSVSGSTSLQAWTEAVVTRYKDDPTVSVYDLLNEPSDPAAGWTADIVRYMTEMEGYVKTIAPNVLCYTGIGFASNVGGATAYTSITAPLDFVGHHNYDSTGFLVASSSTMAAAFATGKPVILDEFGPWSGPYYGFVGDGDSDTNGLPAMDFWAQARSVESFINSVFAYPQVFGALIWSYMDTDASWYDGTAMYEPVNESPVRRLISRGPVQSKDLRSNEFATMECWFDPNTFVHRYPPNTQIGGPASGSTINNLIYDRFNSSSHRPATQANAPFSARHFIEGMVSLRYERVTRHFTQGTTGGTANAHSLIAVITPTDWPVVGSFHYIICPSSNSNGFSVRLTGDGFVQLYRYNNAIVGTGVTALSKTRPNLIIVKWNATTGAWSIRVNGNLEASGSATFTLTNDSMYVGADPTPANGFIGHIFELMKFSSAVTAAEEARCVAYLVQKYPYLEQLPGYVKPLGIPRVTRLDTVHSISSTTGTRVTELSQTLEVGTYHFKYVLLVRSATTTVGPFLGVNFTGTGAPRMHFRFMDATTAITAETHIMDNQGVTGFGYVSGMASNAETTTAPDMGTTIGVAATATDILCFIEGIVVVTVAGDLELWHSSETATATSVEVGSSLIVIRTA